jgi:hypothetical protein
MSLSIVRQCPRLFEKVQIEAVMMVNIRKVMQPHKVEILSEVYLIRHRYEFSGGLNSLKSVRPDIHRIRRTQDGLPLRLPGPHTMPFTESVNRFHRISGDCLRAPIVMSWTPTGNRTALSHFMPETPDSTGAISPKPFRETPFQTLKQHLAQELSPFYHLIAQLFLVLQAARKIPVLMRFHCASSESESI